MLVNTGRDLPIEEVTKENYVLPKGEERIYHVRIEVKKFDSNTGKRQSIPRIQKFGVKAFKTTKKNLLKQGYTLDVLHDPTEWNATQKELILTNAAEKATQLKEAAAQKKADELQALKDELRKELLAELKADQKAATTEAAKPAAKVEETKQEEVAKPGALPTKK